MRSKTDPLIAATKKAYRASRVGQLEALLKEERRWARKQTLARNKLWLVRKEFTEFALILARELDAQ
jgi:hypothetical protein